MSAGLLPTSAEVEREFELFGNGDAVHELEMRDATARCGCLVCARWGRWLRGEVCSKKHTRRCNSFENPSLVLRSVVWRGNG